MNIPIINNRNNFLFQNHPNYHPESLKYIEKVEKVMCDALEFIQGEENAIQYKFPLLLSNTENS